jgi:Kef-type K+ transport system membrane component KefB
MPEFTTVFEQIAAVMLVAAVVAVVAHKLRQPLIVAFIAVGILVGPSALGIIEQPAEIELLAKIGISLLLFVVGLKLDLHLIRSVGRVALATGLGQVAFTSAVGFAIALGLGFGVVTALYIAVALTFSSTIIIVKLLSDKREIDELHGKIAVGFLIVQDIVVVVVMIVLSAFAGVQEGGLALEIGRVLVTGAMFIGAVALLIRWVMTPLMTRLASSPELLVLFSIAWAVALAAFGDGLGFSAEVGAFLAGVSLASTPYREAIATRLVTLRDFLLLFFFIELGSQLDLGLLGNELPAAIVFSLFVLIGNPILVLLIMAAMGYRAKTGFLAGLTVAQISEFSLILAALGLSLGHIGLEAMGLITTVGLVTIGLSTYMILYSHQIYDRVAPALRVFERSTVHEPVIDHADDGPPPEVIVFGQGRYGGSISKHLRAEGRVVLGLDIDPRLLRERDREGLRVRYGDAENPQIAETLPLDHAEWIVCAVHRPEAAMSLLNSLREIGYQGQVAVTAHTPTDEAALRNCGADLLLRPFEDAADDAVQRLATARRRPPMTSADHLEVQGDPANADPADPDGGRSIAGRDPAPLDDAVVPDEETGEEHR